VIASALGFVRSRDLPQILVSEGVYCVAKNHKPTMNIDGVDCKTLSVCAPGNHRSLPLLVESDSISKTLLAEICTFFCARFDNRSAAAVGMVG